MEDRRCVYVGSETGTLRHVLVHRPGKELDRITIDNMQEYLFDDVMWLEGAAREHDLFCDLLRGNGVAITFFSDCLKDILKDSETRSRLLDETLSVEAHDVPLMNALKRELMEMDPASLTDVLIVGMTKKEGGNILSACKSLVYHSMDDLDFLIKPLPNLYFQRDPHVFIGNSVVFSVMTFPSRKREPLLSRYIVQNHPIFENTRIAFGDDERDKYPYTIEGGDIMIINENTVAIGVSQRTSPGTVQIVGRRLAKEAGITKILAVEIPKMRTYMLLDTVVSMIDDDAFVIFPGVEKSIRIWEMTYSPDGKVENISEENSLAACLRRNLRSDNVRLIETGGGDKVLAAREQWNNVINLFPIAPGVIVSYKRNHVSNRVLQDNGFKVYEVKGTELGRGRGGPRAMVMPLKRDSI